MTRNNLMLLKLLNWLRGNIMSMLIDIKYALRLLFKAPKFTAMTLLVLVGGLSISLFTFSFLYSSIYKPLPLPEGETALAISVFDRGNTIPFASNEYLDIKDELNAFAEFGIYQDTAIRLSVEQEGRDIAASYVEAGFFEFSRVSPIMGRVIQASDTLSGADAVTVISYDTWKNELAGDQNVLSKTLILNDIVTQVIGVMPQNYRFPSSSKIWLPLSNDRVVDDVKNPTLFSAYARLKSGVSVEQAETEINRAVNQVYRQNIQDYNLPEIEKVVKLLSFPMAYTGGQGGVIFTSLNVIVWLILLLACINVGNLLLARAIERQKETAIRAALGASTKRLVSQLMWEGVIIATLGGVLSVLLVGAALDYADMAVNSWIPSGGAFWWNYGLDKETILMAIVFTLITIALASFLPAWRSANQDINATLRDGTRGAQSKKAGKISRLLVTAQVFLVALLMLIGSIFAFIANQFVNMEFGDDYNNVMVARMTVPEHKYPLPHQQTMMLNNLLEQIKQHPQVTHVQTNNWIGLSPVSFEGVEYNSDDEKPTIDVITVIGSTETVGLNLKAGREFSHQDTKDSLKTAIISQSMAKRYWPGESPLGKRFNVKINDKELQVSVIGVVNNRMNPTSLFSQLDSADEIYLSGVQFPNPFQILYYRIAPNTQQPENIFYQAMFNIDRHIKLDFAVREASYNRNKMRESMSLVSNITFGTGFFALMLALVGIYGLASNSVAQRTHEVGIRRAVGASDKSITRMFLRQGAKQLTVGLGLALVIFSLISFGFHSFTLGLFPVSFYFILALTVVAALSVVVMFAIYAPTKKAVVMEPSMALRYE